jgi:hypothetical protein
MQYSPAIKTAIDDTRSRGLKGAARLMLGAAPAVRRQLSQTWTRAFRILTEAEASGIDSQHLDAPLDP